MSSATHAIIGGSGLYTLLHDASSITVTTPYGEHASGLTIGRLGKRNIAFLPRHGEHHELPPHLINYRANLWALRKLGVRQILAPCAVGSLTTDIAAGTFVIPEQLVDRTSGRNQTFIEQGAAHVAFADPYCPTSRSTLLKSAVEQKIAAVDGGTMVVIDGPRFSTRAESQAYSRNGWTLVNMTGHPEAVLARELAMCYAVVALVTDLDAGLKPEDAVSQFDVLAEFARHLDPLKQLLIQAIATLPDAPGKGCSCRQALDGMVVHHLP